MAPYEEPQWARVSWFSSFPENVVLVHDGRTPIDPGNELAFNPVNNSHVFFRELGFL